MKKPILTHIASELLFILLFPLFIITAQAQQALTQPKFRGHFTPGALFDTVFDANGNKYSLGEISTNDTIRAIVKGTPISRLTRLPANGGVSSGGTHSAYTPLYSSPYSSGYFKLFLDSASGMAGAPGSTADSNLKVLCQVLTDISNFINSPLNTTGNYVNVWVQPSLLTGSSFLGLAAGIYTMPNFSTTPKSGIVDNAAWIAINSGQDPFTNVASPLYTSGGSITGTGLGTTYFDMVIQFNFSGDYSWNNNLSSSPATGEYDLYTVLLHEIMHSLGFMNLIGVDGRSIFDYLNSPAGVNNYQYYSRYDNFLKTNSGNKLITNTGGCNNMYQYTFNPALTPASVLAPQTYTICPGAPAAPVSAASEILYSSGSVTQYVYTPGCFLFASSLSHFDDEFTTYLPPSFLTTMGAAPTADEYFLMARAAQPGPVTATNPGAMKRYPKPEERDVLCDLGYNVNTTFGVAGDPNLNYINYGGTVCPGLVSSQFEIVG